MAWLAVITAGFLEIGFATMLKLSSGFTRLWPSLGFIVFAAGSFSLLSWSLKVLPIGTAYAVWTGIGIIGVFTYGLFILKDPISVKNIIFVGMILIGIVGLKLGIK